MSDGVELDQEQHLDESERSANALKQAVGAATALR